MSRRPLSDQVVAVTGASSGVGRAIARAFGAAGAKVGLIARGKDGLEAAAEEIHKAGGEALVVPAGGSPPPPGPGGPPAPAARGGGPAPPGEDAPAPGRPP